MVYLALIYCYVIYLFANKLGCIKLLYFLIPILLIVNLLFGDLFVHFGIFSFRGLIRNFALTGIPFFMLGNYIHHNQNKLDENKLFNKEFLIISIITGLTISIIECLITDGLMYSLGNFILGISLFLFSLKVPNISNKALCFLGGKCCFWIYILHPIMIHVIKALFSNLQNSTIIQWITPICVLVSTVIISVIIESIKSKLKKKA